MGTTTVPTWVGLRVTAADLTDQMGAIGGMRATGQQRYVAMLEALSWAIAWSSRAPISGTPWLAKAGSVRVEADAALFVAHYHHAPNPNQWDWLGHPNPPLFTPGDTAEWGYGVWRVLGWLLGDLDTPPPVDDVTRWPTLLPAPEQSEVAAAARRRWR